MATIAVLGTLDSKGEEHAFVAALIVKHGHKPLLIDVGTGGPATVQPDITREQVAASAGIDLAGLMANYTGFLAPKVALFSNIGLMVAILLWRPQGLYPVKS